MGVDPKRYTPAAIHNQISAAKNRLRDAADYRDAVGSPFEEMVADVYELYERDLHRMNAMDFDDLLFRTVNLLELFEEVRERYAAAFRHVLVDEYQDTNHAQYRLLQLLVGGGAASEPERGGRARQHRRGHRNLAVVGDDAQSIYSFRGADVRNILDFQDDFPDARVVKLEQNYRSTETILARRQRGDREQPRRHRQAAVERARAGRADPAARARGRARRGALRRGRDRAARRRGRRARRRSRCCTARTRCRG